jgi:acetyl esterase/lipase
MVAALAVLLSGCLEWPYPPPPGQGPLRYRDPIFTSVTVTRGVTYGTAVNLSNQTVTLLLDVYQPTGDTHPTRPAIVWVHGGSFCCGSRTSPEIVDQATTFAKAGYLNVSIDYRLESPGCSGTLSNCGAAIRQATEDAQTAVRFLKANAASYGIDPTRIAIAGSSAGGITALNVGYSSSEQPDASVRAAVSISGARIGMGTISAGDAPALDFHCTTDALVPWQWAANTENEATAQGVPAHLETWQETCHVPYAAHRQQILTQTTSFLWWRLELWNAPT